jgi:F0F1-type ATP synthase assembly protein I
MAQTTTQTRPRQIDFSHILVIGAWGFAIVIASMLFLYVGHLLDEMLNTPPTFMLGLFFLGLVLCIGRLYKEAWDRIETRKMAKA